MPPLPTSGRRASRPAPVCCVWCFRQVYTSSRIPTRFTHHLFCRLLFFPHVAISHPYSPRSSDFPPCPPASVPHQNFPSSGFLPSPSRFFGACTWTHLSHCMTVLHTPVRPLSIRVPTPPLSHPDFHLYTVYRASVMALLLPERVMFGHGTDTPPAPLPLASPYPNQLPLPSFHPLVLPLAPPPPCVIYPLLKFTVIDSASVGLLGRF